MIGQMGSYEYPSAGLDEPMDCYLHGYVTSRIMRMSGASDQGLPVSIAATKVDGLVLALTPFHHSYNYRSAVLSGYAKPVTDKEEKLYAMKLITDSVVPGRWDHSRTPPDSSELTSTAILRVKIVSGSGKIRNGGPHDDKKDTENVDVTSKTWTGVVPVWENFGRPVPSSENKVQELPSHITSYIHDTNGQNEQFALDAVSET